MFHAHRGLLGSFVAVVALFAALLVNPAAAAQRQHFSDTIDAVEFPRDDLAANCGFPILQTNIGTVQGWFVERPDGTFVADNIHVNLTGTFINPANGKTVTFKLVQNIKDTVNSDGSLTVTIRGIQGRVTIPGRGVVGATIGRLVLTFPAGGGEPRVDFQSGQDNAEAFFGSPGNPGILCGLLA